MSWAGWSAIHKATVWDQLLSTNMRMFTRASVLGFLPLGHEYTSLNFVEEFKVEHDRDA